MFGAVLEIALGLIFVYSLLSLIASTVRELLAQFTSARANVLRRGISALLNETTPGKLTEAFYEHPLVKSLTRLNGSPSYIPGHTFALVLFDLLVHGRDAAATLPISTVERLMAEVSHPNNTLLNDDLGRQLRILLGLAQTLDEAYLIVEQWFNDTPISLGAVWGLQIGKYSWADTARFALIPARIARLFGLNTCQP